MIRTIPYECCDNESLDHLNYLFNTAQNYHSNRHKKNYINFKQPWLAVTFINDEGFSLLQERDLFYGMARLCTRFFWPAQKTKSLLNKNFKLSDGVRPEIYEMIYQQIEYGKKIGIDDFFISREDKTPSIMKRICKGLNKNTKYKWSIDTENQYYVTKNSTQWITWIGHNYLKQI
tara:strand:+ start:2023 stop:2547 length:525 start_codon:yes stop_codon:yes gene_type:complete